MTLEDIATILLGDMDAAVNDPDFIAAVRQHELHPGNPTLKARVARTRQYVAGIRHAFDLVEGAINDGDASR